MHGTTLKETSEAEQLIQPPVFKKDDNAFFYASKVCNRHFLIEDERDEHEKLYHSKEIIEQAIHEITSEIPDLEDK